MRATLRALPSVNELAAQLAGAEPAPEEVAAARAAIAAARAAIAAGGEPTGELLACARAQLDAVRRPSLRRVVNATGVILHTNLGRAPLATAARAAVLRAADGYSNLELQLASGERGSRQDHVEGALCDLTGAQAALAVNNGAAAVLLAVASVCGPGRAVVVGRGQLVEIGGSFRIPEIVAASGTRLIEVGTTNRTRLADYEQGLRDADAAAILRVHPSNFRSLGFVEEVGIEELCSLGAPVIDDAGSGVLGRAQTSAAGEPVVASSVAAGARLVCCSGDKLLGGPQSGLLLGAAAEIARARAHPLARALRLDKLSLAALEATLRIHRDPARALAEIPVLAMLTASEETLAARAQRLVAALAGSGAGPAPIRTRSRVGGGSLPLLELEGPAVALAPATLGPAALAAALRGGEPPIVARVSGGVVVIDPRTLTDADVETVAAGVARALRATPAAEPASRT